MTPDAEDTRVTPGLGTEATHFLTWRPETATVSFMGCRLIDIAHNDTR